MAMPPAPVAPDAAAMTGAPPPPDAGAPPDDLGSRVVAMIPEPKDGKYNPKVVAQLAEQLAETWEAVSEFLPLPPLPQPLVPEGYTGEGKLPPALVVAFTLLLTAVADVAKIDRYLVDVEGLVDDKALNKVTAQLDLLAKDKKARKMLEEMSEPSETDEVEVKETVEERKIPKGVASAM